MVKSGATLLTVGGSCAVSFSVFVAPPPATVAALSLHDALPISTFTVRVIAGYEPLAARASLRVQVPLGCVHVQPVQRMTAPVNPGDTVSPTVTVPLVAAVPEFVTVIV